jgi:hypothetical protein
MARRRGHPPAAAPEGMEHQAVLAVGALLVAMGAVLQAPLDLLPPPDLVHLEDSVPQVDRVLVVDRVLGRRVLRRSVRRLRRGALQDSAVRAQPRRPGLALLALMAQTGVREHKEAPLALRELLLGARRSKE